MKRLCPALALSLCLALPASAQQDLPADPPERPFFDLMERMLRGFMTEIEPQLRDLERGLEALEPQVQKFLDQMGDQMRGMTQYHPPELLPNGDILIRRRAEGAPETPPDPDPAPQDGVSPFEL